MPISAMTLNSVPAEQQSEQRADARRRQRRENRDRMDVAFVEHAEHDVHRHDGGQDQQRLVDQRGLEGVGGPLESCLDARWQPDVAFDGIDGGDGLAKRRALGEVERHRAIR